MPNLSDGCSGDAVLLLASAEQHESSSSIQPVGCSFCKLNYSQCDTVTKGENSEMERFDLKFYSSFKRGESVAFRLCPHILLHIKFYLVIASGLSAPTAPLPNSSLQWRSCAVACFQMSADGGGGGLWLLHVQRYQ